MYKFLLTNNKQINVEMVLVGLEDSDINNHYFLDTQTGEVEIISELVEDDASERLERMEEEGFLKIKGVPTYEQFYWMKDFNKNFVLCRRP